MSGNTVLRPGDAAIDSITVEVIGSALSTIVDQMGKALDTGRLLGKHQRAARLFRRRSSIPTAISSPGAADPLSSRLAPGNRRGNSRAR